MKKILFALSFVLIGQMGLQAQSEVDVLRKMFEVEKKAALADFLQLSATEAPAFWQMYEEYENKRAELGKSRIKLIEEYAKNYTSLTPDKADELVKKAQKLAKQRAKLRSKYYKKSKKLIGSIKAASFFQFESYVDNAVAVEIGNSIPFVGEM